MSLLDNEGDPFEFDPPELERSGSPLMDGEEPYQLHRPKRDRKAKVAEDTRKGLSLRRPKSKDKDASLERTPKRGKHTRSKSGSRTPPDSPGGARALDGAKKAGRVATTQMQPSPNMKSTRKRYSQLGEVESSFDMDDDSSGFLLTNQGSGDQEPPCDLPPDPPPSPPSPSAVTGESEQPTQLVSPPRRLTVQFPVNFIHSELDTNERRAGRVSMDSVAPPGSLGVVPQDLGSPSQIAPLPPLQFFQSPLPPQPLPTLPSLPPHPPRQPDIAANPAPEGEWALSDELRHKCHGQFAELHPDSGFLHGDKARVFFQQSKLPNQELSQIWRLADQDRDNALSEHEFCVAMKLVLMRRKGYDIPTSLPEALREKPSIDPFSDTFLSAASQPQSQAFPPPPQQAHSRPPPQPVQTSKSLVELPVASGEPSKPVLAQVVQKSSPELLRRPSSRGEEEGSKETGKAEEELAKEIQVPSPILVEIGDAATSDTGPLVCPQSSQEVIGPRVGRIISIEGDSEDEGDEKAALMQADRRRRTGSDSSLHEKEPPTRGRTTRPAPPRPMVRRAESLKQAPSCTDRDVHHLEAEAGGSDYTPMIKVQEPSPKVSARKQPRPSALGRTGERYTTLASTNSSGNSSPVNGEVEEVDGKGGTFNWQQLHSTEEEGGAQSPSLVARQRGHARSSSLDLKKMLQGNDSSSVQEDRHYKDLPSAVPPKPPPKPPSHRPANTDEAGDVEKSQVMRGRSASTGSITTPGERHSATPPDEDFSLLIAQKGPPPIKPRPPKKVPVLPPHPKPKRPAPAKPSRPEVDADSRHTAKTPLEESYLVLRDKGELQLNIRSLKETNLALSAINKGLEETLFKLMEERVQLSRELELAQQQL